jgi:hypothetical protein
LRHRHLPDVTTRKPHAGSQANLLGNKVTSRRRSKVPDMSDRCQLYIPAVVCTEYCYIRPVPTSCSRKQPMYAVLAFMTTGGAEPLAGWACDDCKQRDAPWRRRRSLLRPERWHVGWRVTIEQPTIHRPPPPPCKEGGLYFGSYPPLVQ